MTPHLPWTFALLGCSALAAVSAQVAIPPYIKQCRAKDPKLTSCVIEALHHLKPYLATGIPEIRSPPVEPFNIDELSLALTQGPQGYRITLKNMDVFGASNFTVIDLKLGKDGSPFTATLKMPMLTMSAEYKSSGVLLILPASGSGVFHNTMRDVTAFLNGTVRFRTTKKGNEHMRIDQMEMRLETKSINMYIDKAFLNAPVLREATNLFLKENGLEVLDAMRLQLNTKLGAKFLEIGNNVLRKTPINLFLVAD